MISFIQGLPKAELHLHIEGTFEPELMFEIAARNGITLPYESVEALHEAYDFSELQDFLNIYYQGMNVLLNKQDYFDLTWAYLKKVNAQNVRHVELFFDPQGHTSRGVEFGTVIEGIQAALDKAEREFDQSSRIIMCFLRHLDEEDALRTLETALPYKHLIAGVGLDSSELGNPPEKFERVFAQAKMQGYHLVAHAGEEGPPDYIRQALDLLKIERVDHGNTAMQDDALLKRLVDEKIPLTVCPLSNLKLCVVEELEQHPLREMLDRGVCATINSDDPAYFGGYMNENFIAVENALSLGRERLTTLSRNGFESAFIGEDRRQQLLAELEEYVASGA
jgi:adenosine deaminase